MAVFSAVGSTVDTCLCQSTVALKRLTHLLRAVRELVCGYGDVGKVALPLFVVCARVHCRRPLGVQFMAFRHD